MKFRAWDKTKKRWISPINFDFPTSGLLMVAGMGTKWYELSQFTGLKDKNEKEIYEGDIVRIGTNQAIFAVEYVENSMEFVFTREIGNINAPSKRFSADREKRLKETSTIEVIGNVYESPELLAAAEKEKDQNNG